MRNSILYFKHRSPLLLAILTLAIGIALSGFLLSQNSVHFVPFILSLIGIFGVFCLQVAMESKEILVKSVELMQILLLVYSMILWLFLQAFAALTFVVLVVYLWLNYKQFYYPGLSKHLILSGFLRQAAAFPLAAFAFAVGSKHFHLNFVVFSYGLLLFGAFSVFALCRILDPQAHPSLATPVQFFGFRKVFEAAAICLALSAMGAISLNLEWFLIPIEITVLLTLVILFFRIDQFRLPELAVRLSLLVHGWSGAIQHIF